MHHIYRQITGLRGYRPVVLAQKIENTETFPFPEIRVVERSRFRFAARAIERNITHRPWQMSRPESARILSALLEVDASVLHLFFGNVAVHMLPLLESLPIPCVLSFHGADVTGAIARENYRPARAAMFHLATLVACRSQALMGSVARLGCPASKLRLLRTALPNIDFTLRELPPDGAIRIVQACRLIPKKGLATSIRAFAKFAIFHPTAEFHIAGDGPLKSELARLAKSLGVSDRVHFTDFLGQDALQRLYASAHVFLHPSEMVNGDVEGIPNSMLEAMASGLPIVATRHGGIPEAVTDGRSGLLVDEEDPDAVAEALSRITSDPRTYSRMSDAAAADARAKFSHAAQCAAAVAIYDEACALHREARSLAGTP